MIKKIIMPSAGQTTNTATVTKLSVKVGDEIKRGQVVAEVETDKATLPIESYAEGYICEVHVKEFDVIDAGAPLFSVGGSDDLAEAQNPSKKESEEKEPITPVKETAEIPPAPIPAVREAPAAQPATPAMPGAKKLAAELGVNLASVAPSNGSFIKTADVRSAADKKPAAPIISHSADFSALRDYISYITEVIGVPSAAITVWRGHEELFFCKSGVMDRKTNEPIRRDALYYMYSCSKVVTCVAAMQLFERGKFLLLDPVGNYLPEYADVRVGHGGYTVPPKSPMLIRDLFTMSSGLTYNLATVQINDVAVSTGKRCPTREVVKAIAASPLSFDPSTRYLYSLSHDVLAALVEVISGMRFSDYVKKNIFDPLGMKDSCFHIENIDISRMAAQYRYNEKTKLAEQIPLTNSYVIGTEYDSGGAGIISSLDDYIRFADALACRGTGATGARIISPSTIDLMRENQLDPLRMEDFHRAFTQFRGYGYGLGVRTLIDRTAGSLSPLGEFGWGGAAGAYLLADPSNELSICYVQHMLNNQERIIHPRLRNITYASLGL